jgi:hypothetical protein
VMLHRAWARSSCRISSMVRWSTERWRARSREPRIAALISSSALRTSSPKLLPQVVNHL